MNNQSDLFVQFLKEHPLINIRGLQKALGVPHPTIAQCLTKNSTRKIPEKYWYDLYLTLTPYGFEYPEVTGDFEGGI